MKIVKLDRRHTLYHRGYHYAFVGNRWTAKSNKLESAVKKLEGWHWDSTFWGKSKFNKELGHTMRPYYIGFKKESTATMALLLS